MLLRARELRSLSPKYLKSQEDGLISGEEHCSKIGEIISEGSICALRAERHVPKQFIERLEPALSNSSPDNYCAILEGIL